MEIWRQIALDRENGARELVAEYGDRLFRRALMLCRDEHAAEDLVFRTLERVVDKIGLYNPEMSFWNWTYTLMLNLFRTDLRKMRVEVVDEPEMVDELADDGEAMSHIADAALVRRAVEGLSPALREAVALRYFEDRSIEEIAALLAVPTGTVKRRLHEARTRLAQVLKAFFSQN